MSLQRGFSGISCFIWSGLMAFCMTCPWYINTQILHLAGSKTPLWHLISCNLQSPEENSLRISHLYFLPMFAVCPGAGGCAVLSCDFLLNATWYLCTEDLHSPALLVGGEAEMPLSSEALRSPHSNPGFCSFGLIHAVLITRLLCCSLKCFDHEILAFFSPL